MSADFRNQVDITPATNPPSIHVHVPNGVSANTYNNPSDFPAPPHGGTAVTVKVSGVRFSNPS